MAIRLNFMVGVDANGDIVDLFDTVQVPRSEVEMAQLCRGLAGCTRLLEKLGPADEAGGGGLDALGEGVPWATDAVQEVVEMGAGSPGSLSYTSDRVAASQEAFLEVPVHGMKCNSETLLSQALTIGCVPLAVIHSQGMGWLQAPAFKRQLREYQERTCMPHLHSLSLLPSRTAPGHEIPAPDPRGLFFFKFPLAPP